MVIPNYKDASEFLLLQKHWRAHLVLAYTEAKSAREVASTGFPAILAQNQILPLNWPFHD